MIYHLLNQHSAWSFSGKVKWILPPWKRNKEELKREKSVYQLETTTKKFQLTPFDADGYIVPKKEERDREEKVIQKRKRRTKKMLVSAALISMQQKGYEDEDRIWNLKSDFCDIVFQILEGRRNKAAETEEDIFCHSIGQ